MNTKMHIQQALAAGFSVDTRCNPPIAYMGARFNPSVFVECFTEVESALVAMLPLVAAIAKDLDSPHCRAAQLLIENPVLADIQQSAPH